MDTNKTRRRLFGIIGGSAAAIAFAELRPAKATGGKPGTKSGSKSSTKSNTATSTKTGTKPTKPTKPTKTHTKPPTPPICQDPGQCPPGCTCSGGQCVPTTPAYNCVAETYNVQVTECTRRQLAVNCSKVRKPARRKQCQARKRRGIATCRSAALQYSKTVCTPA